MKRNNILRMSLTSQWVLTNFDRDNDRQALSKWLMNNTYISAWLFRNEFRNIVNNKIYNSRGNVIRSNG